MAVESYFTCIFCKVIVLGRINLCAFADVCLEYTLANNSHLSVPPQ